MVSGSHVNSLAALNSGSAGVMAMDCVTHALLARHRPERLGGTRVIGTSDPVPAPPFVTSAAAHRATVAILREAILAAVADRASRDARRATLPKGAELVPLQAYSRIPELEGIAFRHGYVELHATSANTAAAAMPSPDDRPMTSAIPPATKAHGAGAVKTAQVP